MPSSEQAPGGVVNRRFANAYSSSGEAVQRRSAACRRVCATCDCLGRGKLDKNHREATYSGMTSHACMVVLERVRPVRSVVFGNTVRPTEGNMSLPRRCQFPIASHCPTPRHDIIGRRNMLSRKQPSGEPKPQRPTLIRIWCSIERNRSVQSTVLAVPPTMPALRCSIAPHRAG